MTTPPTTLSGPAPRHSMLVFGTPAERVSALGTWAARGLAAGERVIYEAADDADATALREAVALTGVASEAGQFEVRSAGSLVRPEQFAELLRETRLTAWSGVRVAAASQDALLDLPHRTYQRHERQLDGMCGRQPLHLICAYDRAVPDVALTRAFEAHDRVVGPAVEVAVGPGRVRVAGAIDETAATVLRAALRRLQRDAAVTRQLDLAEVWLLSAAGLRVVLETAEVPRMTGRRLRVVAGPATRLVLDAVHRDLTDAVEVVEPLIGPVDPGDDVADGTPS